MKNPSRDPIFQAQEASSATECTGLMPAQIETDEEGQNLAELEAIHPIKHGNVNGNNEE